jgi:hypothetical protein
VPKIEFSALKLSSLFNVNINVGTVNLNAPPAGGANKPTKAAEKKVFLIEENTLVIDPEALNRRQRHLLKELLASEMLDQAGAILDETAQPTINASLEVLPQMEETANQLVGIIPARDIPLLYAALYLRSRFKLGESIDHLKAQIVRVYGNRGAHFANLCTAGYLENWFLPLHQELVRQNANDAGLARSRFRKIYNNIVDDLPWTIFVSGTMPAAKLVSSIVEKMRNNSELGVRHLNLHALGPSNVKKVARALPEIMERTGAIVALQEQEKGRIFLRLELGAQPGDS